MEKDILRDPHRNDAYWATVAMAARGYPDRHMTAVEPV
jgi:hypothetical protein